MKCGESGTSWRTDVVFFLIDLIIYRQSFKASLRYSSMMTNSGFTRITCYNEKNRLLPHGIPKVTCYNFTARDWNLFRGVDRQFKHFFISLSMVLLVSAGSCMVNSLPLQIHPRISLVKSHSPSPFPIFFSDMELPQRLFRDVLGRIN